MKVLKNSELSNLRYECSFCKVDFKSFGKNARAYVKRSFAECKKSANFPTMISYLWPAVSGPSISRMVLANACM